MFGPGPGGALARHGGLKRVGRSAIDFAEASPERPLDAFMEDNLVETTG